MSLFKPNFHITNTIAHNLMRIEAARDRIKNAPLTTKVLKSLRETARLFSTHYSTMIEGNRLSLNQIEQVLKQNEHFPGKERDEKEVRGYYAGLEQIDTWVNQKKNITELMIQTMHALIMHGSETKIIATPYRDQQNVIRDSHTNKIVYLPPEAADVPALMKAFVAWIHNTKDLPYPLIAAVAHYQFVTIHPYLDGNGRTARLLTTFLLHHGGYGLKGLYSLEEYYAQDLNAYYEALTIGPSHNYYLGRAEADITSWIEYFCQGMAHACENVLRHMEIAHKRGATDQSHLLRQLDVRQREILSLFEEYNAITAKQVSELLGIQPRTARALCQKFIEEGFLMPIGTAKKGRKYILAESYITLIR